MKTDDEIIEMLGISISELEEMKQADKAIDRDEKLFELADDLKAGAKKARRAERKTETNSRAKKPKVANNQKLEIIQNLVKAIEPLAENVNVENPERIFTFTVNGTKYKITMSCPRT